MKSLIYFGGEIKALDDQGRVGGYLIRFSDDGKHKDLSGEYFTSETYLGAREGNGVDILFHHGQPLPMKSILTAAAQEEISGFQNHIFKNAVETKRTAIGIWAEAVLDLADEYEKAVYGMVKRQKLGWSSGALGHQVQKDGDGRIKRWIIGEASLTPTPAEPLNRAMDIDSLSTVKFVQVDDEEPEPKPAPPPATSLAAQLKQFIADRVDDGHTEEAITASLARAAGLSAQALKAILEDSGIAEDAHLKAFARVLKVDLEILRQLARKNKPVSIKGMFKEAMDNRMPHSWELEHVYGQVMKQIARAHHAANLAGLAFNMEQMVGEATDEYAALKKKQCMAQIKEWMDGGAEDDFYMKAFLDQEATVRSLASADLDAHSQLAVSALRDLAGRFSGIHEGRLKAGRVLSEKNRQRIARLCKDGKAVFADLETLLEETKPMGTMAGKNALITKHLQRKLQQRQLEK